MAKDSKYNFFESYHNALSRVSDERYGRVVRAMSAYVFKHENPNFSDDADWIVWELIRPILERGIEISEIRADAGANGGRKGRGVSRNKGNRNAAKDMPEINSKQKQINSKQKQINSGIGDGIGDGEEITDSSLHSESLSSCDDPQIGNDMMVISEKKEDVDYNALVMFFNTTMNNNNAQIPRIRDISGKRRNFVNARIKQYGKQSLQLVIEKAAVSSFLNGGGNQAFLASFDWLMRPDNFRKTMEGNYDDRQLKSTPQSRAEDAAAIIARLAAEDAARERMIQKRTNDMSSLIMGT